MDPYARQLAMEALVLSNAATGAIGYRHDGTTGLKVKVYTSTGVTTATGAVSFTLPASYFTVVTYAHCQVVRDTADPKLGAFAMVRTCSAAAVTAQVFESKTSAVLVLNTQVEGLETTAVAGLTVLLLAVGY